MLCWFLLAWCKLYENFRCSNIVYLIWWIPSWWQQRCYPICYHLGPAWFAQYWWNWSRYCVIYPFFFCHHLFYEFTYKWYTFCMGEDMECCHKTVEVFNCSTNSTNQLTMPWINNALIWTGKHWDKEHILAVKRHLAGLCHCLPRGWRHFGQMQYYFLGSNSLLFFILPLQGLRV